MDAFEVIPASAGPIGLFSSDEFLPGALAFDDALIGVSGSEIAVLFCADHRNASHNARNAERHFAKLGARATPLPIRHQPANADIDILPAFDLLYLPGGSPTELLACLTGTYVWRAIEQRWREGAALAGSSAGAMALCSQCMLPRPGDDRPMTWGRGLGPLQQMAVAVHATSRPKQWLEQMARSAPVPLLAVDDSTGVLLRADAAPEVIGSGRAWFVPSQG